MKDKFDPDPPPINTIVKLDLSQSILYTQIEEQIVAEIRNGDKLPYGQRIWSLNDASEGLDVTKKVVTKAYKNLLKSYVAPERGVCYRVIFDKPLRKLSDRGLHLYNLSKNICVQDPKPFSMSLPEVTDMESRCLKYYESISKFIRAEKNMNETRKYFSYSSPSGHENLKKEISKYLKTRKVDCEPDQITIVTGAQQALDIITWITLDANDLVWIEEPSYSGARIMFNASQAKLIPVQVDEDGLDVNTAIASKPTPRLIYVTPQNQYPTNVTMSKKRREDLIEYAINEEVLILEDDHSPFRYVDGLNESLFNFNKRMKPDRQLVFYIGSFTKTMFPSLRLGYIVAPPDMTNLISSARSVLDLSLPMLSQEALYYYLKNNEYEEYIKKKTEIYEEKQKFLVAQVRQSALNNYFYLKPTASIGSNSKIVSEGGMEIILYAKSNILNWFNDKEFSKYAMQKNHNDYSVVTQPFSSLFIDDINAEQGLVLGYAGFSENELEDYSKYLIRHLENYKANHCSQVNLS